MITRIFHNFKYNKGKTSVLWGDTWLRSRGLFHSKTYIQALLHIFKYDTTLMYYGRLHDHIRVALFSFLDIFTCSMTTYTIYEVKPQTKSCCNR